MPDRLCVPSPGLAGTHIICPVSRCLRSRGLPQRHGCVVAFARLCGIAGLWDDVPLPILVQMRPSCGFTGNKDGAVPGSAMCVSARGR